MQNRFITRLEETFANKVFTDNDLKILFPDKELSQIHNSLSYHFKNGFIKKYRRGLYTINKGSTNKNISKFLISNYLYGPSYITFASALSYYNLIPEAVYETTAASFQEKKKNFKNEDGIFTFNHIPVIPFFLDVLKAEHDKFLIAKPLRALFDTIYSERKLYSNIKELEQDLRLDLAELNNYLNEYTATEIIDLGEQYKKKSTSRLAQLLIKEFK